MAIHAQRTLATTALLAALSLPASAQLSIRLEPELDDPGTSALPARLGDARGNGEAGAALQMAIVYDLRPTMPLPDRARSGAEPVDRLHLKRGLGHTAGLAGWIIRPKLGLYYLKTQQTDSPASAPPGSAAGTWLGLEADLYPSFSARTKLSYAGKFAHDAHASGDRLRDNYRKHTFSAEYLLYNHIDPPKGRPQFSLTLNRSLGADPLDGSPAKKSSTGLYLGMKL